MGVHRTQLTVPFTGTSSDPSVVTEGRLDGGKLTGRGGGADVGGPAARDTVKHTWKFSYVCVCVCV